GARCTCFVAEASPLTVRKQWIAGSLQPVGELHVDAGAVRALRDGRSLLPAGVTKVDGHFDRGDPVVVLGPDGAESSRRCLDFAGGMRSSIATTWFFPDSSPRLLYR